MIKTIKLKELLKYLVGLISIILICVYSTRYFSNLNGTKMISIFDIDYTAFIKSNIAIASIEKKSDLVIQEADKYTSRSGVIRILDMELPNIEENKVDEVKEAEETPTRS